MRTIKTPQGITLNYQDEGDKKSPVIILIMGLGAQMTVWPDSLYYGLVKKGFRVIRFDNRDTGLSTHLEHHTNPSLFKSWLSKRLPIRAKTPYLLDDMADDVLALMAALKIKKAHFVGASMGGMIAQLIAAQHKKKVLSLTTIMSSSSLPRLSAKSIGVFIKLAKLQPKNTSHDEAINYNIKLNQLIGSPAYPQSEDALRHHATQIVERSHNPSGYKRQLIAMAASKNRQHLIRKIKTPTLVIHGCDDVVIPVSAGKKTAALIKKAKLRVVPGMGHNFAPELMPLMTKWIVKHVKKAQRKHLNKKRKKQQQQKTTLV
ncbi:MULTISPECIES: alpha/beta fold hydrolase [Pseudoalteromonas]|uniref:alpha/beta fold hydrolase n=1 Tax=Pseudoalteromonas TaxID=53246 RepID=UPI0007320E12|nr:MULTISPECIES: alpha/beta hydrolase [Pseudoalteromonas]KTF17339.1 hydrolase [Pseudoalteromonas sp. H103]MDO6546685.1 alpha/beta hydrolase [Pseudoalteromonas carrageenovora]MDO6830656.1 alpha/beta hydrolase [Pseudoalteromonas carrageenovora]